MLEDSRSFRRSYCHLGSSVCWVLIFPLSLRVFVGPVMRMVSWAPPSIRAFVRLVIRLRRHCRMALTHFLTAFLHAVLFLPFHASARDVGSSMEGVAFPASNFISSDRRLPVDGAILLDTESEETGSDMGVDSVGSSMIEHYAGAAISAIPSSDGSLFFAQDPVVDDGHWSDPQDDPYQPDANKKRSGGMAGMGGRPEGTGLRTRENFPRGARRVLAEALQLRGSAAALDNPLLGDVSDQGQRDFAALIEKWRNEPGKEEIWSIPYLFGVAARFSVWGKTDHGKRSACCTWVAAGGAVRCTCVGSDVYNGDVGVSRATVCEHVAVLSGAAELMAAAMGTSAGQVLEWLHTVLAAQPPNGTDADIQDGDEVPVWRVHRDNVIVVSMQRGASVPVPVYLPKKGVSCGFCPLTSSRGCSHTKAAEQYRSVPGNVPTPSATASFLRSAVSTRSLSLFNCPKAIAFDRKVGEMARQGAVFKMAAPTRCSACGASMPNPGPVPDSALPGVLHSTLGPCDMSVVRRTCAGCMQCCSRDGREDSVLLLSWTSGCSVVWARRCAEQVRAGTHISDVITGWLSDWTGLKTAALLPAKSKWRGADTLRAMILAFMRLTVSDPDHGLYDCSVCRLPCGRYKVVTSDGICLGWDAKSMPFSFEHQCEPVPFVNTKGREGCLVVGELARRLMRHVFVPNDPAAITDRTLPSAELALSCLGTFSCTEDADGPRQSSSSSSIRTLLGLIWKIDSAALPLAESLLHAYANTKVKRVKEQKRRAVCAVVLRRSIEDWRRLNPAAAACGARAWTACDDEVEDGGRGASGEQGVSLSQGGEDAEGDGEAMEVDGGGRGARGRAPAPDPIGPVISPGHSSRARGGTQAGKKAVKPGEEPALNIPKPLLRDHLLVLEDNDVDHICRMALAFALDPVVAGVKERHVKGLTRIADALLSDAPRLAVDAIAAEATSRLRTRAPLSDAASCLVQLRHILVALQAAVLVFDECPAFAKAMAEVLLDAVSSAKAFYAEFSAEVRQKHEYMQRYLNREQISDEELINAFRRRYPDAAAKTSATGVFMPGRDQCRAEAYAKGDKTSCGLCEKTYLSGDKYTDGALTFCCACAHPKILGFVVLDRKESPQVLINTLLARFPRLPRYLVYDFACGVVRCAMAKLPWMLRELSVVSDRFHVCNHTCSHFYNANSYGELDFTNTLTHEQRNSKICKMESILRGAGRYGYLALLCYQTSVLNSFAESRTVHQQRALAAAAAAAQDAHGSTSICSAVAAAAEDASKTDGLPRTNTLPTPLALLPNMPRVALPLHFDMRSDYFTRHACRCCGYRHVRDAPAQAT